MFEKFKNSVWKWIKTKFKIRSWDIFKADISRSIDRKIYRKTYSTSDIINLMRSMGLKKGSNIFIHSSWNEFFNYTGTINEFIDAVLAEIGSEGTLAMPAYPLLRKADSIFDIKNTPTAAGIVAETFRGYPDVKRSVNRHSVCALGPLSNYLLDEHQYSITCWDEKSPYYKLGETNSLIFAFGLGKYFVGTTMHCADSILRTELPYFALFFQKEDTYKVRLLDKTICAIENLTHSEDFSYYFTNRSHNRVISKFFDKTKYSRRKISNLTVNVYDANYLINRSTELARKGIVVYTKPDPRKFAFKN